MESADKTTPPPDTAPIVIEIINDSGSPDSKTPDTCPAEAHVTAAEVQIKSDEILSKPFRVTIEIEHDPSPSLSNNVCKQNTNDVPATSADQTPINTENTNDNDTIIIPLNLNEDEQANFDKICMNKESLSLDVNGQPLRDCDIPNAVEVMEEEEEERSQKVHPEKSNIMQNFNETSRSNNNTITQPMAGSSDGFDKNIYVEDTGNRWYNVTGKYVTPAVKPSKLADAFGNLPICGRPKSKNHLEEFLAEKHREFLGINLCDDEYESLLNQTRFEDCITGSEMKMSTTTPHPNIPLEYNSIAKNRKSNLRVVRRVKLRNEKDLTFRYPVKVAYRGLNMMPLSEIQDFDEEDPPDSLLIPGKDILFRIRIYRSFPYSLKDRHNRSRHSVFSHDVVLFGRQRLTALRDRIVCANDMDMRVDVSENIDDPPALTARDVFPSGFLFINNVFYVDRRGACSDISAGLRKWAERRGRGSFPVVDMSQARLQDIVMRLGHPEVYVHQGNCEHLFTFSEVRLVNPSDPLKPSHYPAHTAVAQNQTIYCTACAEYGAKWIVVGCTKVPFDPAFFCEMCLKRYLYKDGEKIGNFKAYSYKGNEVNLLKSNNQGTDFTEDYDLPTSTIQNLETPMPKRPRLVFGHSIDDSD